MDESEAVRRAQAGDVDAYEWLVRQYSAAAIRLAAALCGGRADAEDVAQEAFLKVFHSLDRFRPDAPLQPWLLRIVANEAKNHHRSARRRTAMGLRVAYRREGGPSSPEDTVVATGDAEAILDAVASLSETDRLVIGYRYFAGLSERETAAAMGCRLGTVKSRLARALTRLRPRLADLREDGLDALD